MKQFLFLVALTIAMVSCKSEIEEPTVVTKEEPTVVTKSIKEITESTAKVEGQVAADGGAEVTERGVCWNTDGMPTILDYRVKDAEVGLGTFASNIIDLEANTTYYVRAYAINEVGTSYGEEMSFTTREMVNPDPDEPEIPSHEWVDLGLSVKWATCNIGATSPEKYGNRYSWGAGALSKEELESSGYVDSDGNLTSAYDIATVNWGEGWRMPTEEEINELIKKGIWTWQYQNGVKGYKVNGPSGNSIFLPAANDGYGEYWSSTLNEIKTLYGVLYEAGGLCFYKDDYFQSSSSRGERLAIRPVLD